MKWAERTIGFLYLTVAAVAYGTMFYAAMWFLLAAYDWVTT